MKHQLKKFLNKVLRTPTFIGLYVLRNRTFLSSIEHAYLKLGNLKCCVFQGPVHQYCRYSFDINEDSTLIFSPKINRNRTFYFHTIRPLQPILGYASVALCQKRETKENWSLMEKNIKYLGCILARNITEIYAVRKINTRSNFWPTQE